VPVMPGAEPWSADAAEGSPLGHVGVAVIHGFTGCPQSMRPWAEALAEAGCAVRLPRLPGHGTTWQELAETRWPDWYAEADRAVRELQERCSHVFAVGLSMGGTLTLRLAEEHGDAIAGIVTVNATLTNEDKRLRLLPLLTRVLKSVPGVAGDIAKPGATELGYDRVPVKAIPSLLELMALTLADLGRVTSPALIVRSAVDHVVPPSSGRALMAGLAGNPDVEELVLPDSLHVATLDHDAPVIFARSLEHIRRIAG
jgi:carboxylesterase